MKKKPKVTFTRSNPDLSNYDFVREIAGSVLKDFNKKTAVLKKFIQKNIPVAQQPELVRLIEEFGGAVIGADMVARQLDESRRLRDAR